jgi:predicted transcriptional regulator
MPKAIIETVRPGTYLAAAHAVAERLDAGEDLPETDYHLGFANAAQLFEELTPARMTLLETLQHSGPSCVEALAAQLDRAVAIVQADAARLLEHDLVRIDQTGRLFVPWEQVQITVTLPAEQAA